MNLPSISTLAILILSPYAKKAGEAFANAAGESAFEKSKQLLDWLKRKFAGDAVAERDISRFENDPDKFGPGLEETIAERIKDDPDFAEELRRHLNDIATVVQIHQKSKYGKEVTGVEGDILKATVTVIQEIEEAEGLVGVKGKIGL